MVFKKDRLWDFLAARSATDRFWGYGTAQILPNISTIYKIQSPDGIDPLNLKAYNQFIQISHQGTLAREFTRTTRSDSFVAPGYGENDLSQNQTRLRILDMLGVRYVIDRDENASTAITFPPNRFQPIWKNSGWTIFENSKAAPRFFLTHEVVPYNSMEEFENFLFSPEFNPSGTVLISSQNQLPTMQSDPSKEIKLLRYDPTTITF